MPPPPLPGDWPLMICCVMGGRPLPLPGLGAVGLGDVIIPILGPPPICLAGLACLMGDCCPWPCLDISCFCGVICRDTGVIVILAGLDRGTP